MKIILDNCLLSVKDVISMNIIEAYLEDEEAEERLERLGPPPDAAPLDRAWFYTRQFFTGPKYKRVVVEKEPTKVFQLKIDFIDETNSAMVFYSSKSESFAAINNHFQKVVTLMGYEKADWGFGDKKDWM